MMGLRKLLSYVFGSKAPEAPTEGNDTDLVKVHEYSNNPTKAWEVLRVNQKVIKVKLLPLGTPVYEDRVRFVCMSDTHNKMPLRVDIPKGDVLLHSGDFSMHGKPHEVESFNDWLGTLPFRYKLVIAGNHDATFDEATLKDSLSLLRHGMRSDRVKGFMKEKGITHMKELLTNCTYLEDSETSVYGIRVYGSPWQSGQYYKWVFKWGFNLPRGQACLDKWNLIPEGIDILLTHGPPVGHGDRCADGARAGCVELLSTIQHRVKCKYHIFGHIHEGYGMTTDGVTKFINAATCNKKLDPCNQPIIFDIELPTGFTKDDVTSMSMVNEGATAISTY